MKALKIEKTPSKPFVYFNADNGILWIEGRSIPENPDDFYSSLMLWLNKYFTSPQQQTVLEIKLEYINSGSSKLLLEIFKIIKANYDKGKNCIVNWHYEEDDEAVYELGKHFATIVEVPFNLLEFD